jgi:hypothetical protein
MPFGEKRVDISMSDSTPIPKETPDSAASFPSVVV